MGPGPSRGQGKRQRGGLRSTSTSNNQARSSPQVSRGARSGRPNQTLRQNVLTSQQHQRNIFGDGSDTSANNAGHNAAPRKGATLFKVKGTVANCSSATRFSNSNVKRPTGSTHAPKQKHQIPAPAPAPETEGSNYEQRFTMVRMPPSVMTFVTTSI